MTELEMEISTSRPYLFFGEDSFSLKKHVSKLKKSLNQGDLADSNTSILDGQHLKFEELNSKCATVPFLASHRLVIVENLFSAFEHTRTKPKGSKLGDDAASESLSQWKSLSGNDYTLPNSTVLIFTDGNLSTRNALLSKMRPKLQIREFKLPKGAQLIKWIYTKAAEKEANIPANSATLLSNLIGPNLWALDNELSKLAIYCKGRTIKPEDIKLLVHDAREASIFELIDSILARNHSKAIKAIENLIEGGSNSSHIISMLARQIRLTISIKEMLSKKTRLDQIGNRLGIKSEFYLKKTIDQAKSYPVGGILETYNHLVDADISIKRGTLAENIALEILTAELCTI